jgi:hypothetical protein
MRSTSSPHLIAASPAGACSRSRGAGRVVAVACAAALAVASTATPLVAAAAAQSSVLQQAQGTSVAPGAQPSSSSAGGGVGSGGRLDVPANFNAPGADKGEQLIGWAKAGALILGTLGLMTGAVVGKLMRQAGNHHAEGVRASAMGIGGAMVLAGSAAQLVTWLMGS